MRKLNKIIIILSCIMSFFIVPVNAINSTLTIHYLYDSQNIEDLEVETYYIASYNNGVYELSDRFKNYSIDLSHISSQSEWKEIAMTLASYIIADGLESDYIGKTNKDGQVTFSQLNTGLYLTLGNEVQLNNKIIGYETFLTVLPESNHSYTVKPKYSSYDIEYNEKEYKVIKQWKDKDYIDTRVKNVSVDLYKDRQFYKNIMLNAENNWTYEWTHKDDGSQWSVVERNIDKNYKVSIYEDKDTYIITNTYQDNGHKVPSTGDSTNIVFYMTTMSISGLLLILLAVILRKKHHD